MLSYMKDDDYKKIDDFIKKQNETIQNCFKGPFKMPINGYTAYYILPTGSKAGWSPADELDTAWEEFKDILYEISEYPRFVSYGFGDEMSKFRVEEASDNIIDFETNPKEILKGKEFYEVMKPVHKLIGMLYDEYPEILTKYPEMFEEIITKAGMKDLQCNDQIIVDEYWL